MTGPVYYYLATLFVGPALKFTVSVQSIKVQIPKNPKRDSKMLVLAQKRPLLTIFQLQP